jgi:putative ABC transport system permease protein
MFRHQKELIWRCRSETEPLVLRARDTLGHSLLWLGCYRLRSALCILGFTAGIATLITIVTLVEGAAEYARQRLAALGSNVFRVARLPFATTDLNVAIRAMHYRKFGIEDVQAVAVHCPDCDRVGASVSLAGSARYEGTEVRDIDIIGHTQSMDAIDTRVVEQGRYFTPTEESHRVPVCLLGADVRERLFPAGTPAIGHLIRLDGRDFSVVGVMGKLGSAFGESQDNFAIIPLTVYQDWKGPGSSLTIQVKTSSPVHYAMAKDEVRRVLRSRRHLTFHQDDDFFIGTNESSIRVFGSISSAFFAAFVLLSLIASVIGGIVIMNVMLVSVTERTREIGVRRAVGATRGDVLRQFLAETVLQCLIGGAAGVCAGFATAILLGKFSDLPSPVGLPVAILGLALSASIGLFFGVYPAIRASRLDPIAALREE